MKNTEHNIFIEEVYKNLLSDLNSFDIISSIDSKNSLRSLIRTFYQGLSGELSPKFYLNSLPPGSGKTQAISSFVRVWKSKGFLPAGGILIALKTKDEIQTLADRLDLDKAEFAAFTRDDAINALGRSNADNAPVLITTQQMVISRTEDRTFAGTSAFHYRGKPRALRIWDESFIRAEPVSFDLYGLRALPSILGYRFPALADEISAFSDVVGNAEPGDRVRVPGSIGEALKPARSAIAHGSFKLQPASGALIDGLYKTLGRELIVLATGGKANRSLAGSSRPMPADIAPLIITDASGDVRSTYSLMEQASGNLVRLPSAPMRYSKMHIHLWETSASKETLGNSQKNGDVYRHITKAMTEVAGPWLVISFKGAQDKVDVEAELKSTLRGEVDFSFLNWGRHHGINAYKDVRNILVVGSYFYPPQAYSALGIASVGLPVSKAPDIDRMAVKAGEFQHNMLQAILRGNARNSVDGVAGECDVYIIASARNHARRLLAATFPGAEISNWGPPKNRPLTGHAKAVMDAIDRLMTSSVMKIRKKDIYTAANISKNEFHRQTEKPVVQVLLRARGIISQGQHLVRRGSDGGTAVDEIVGST
jgi:hypothetical protein